MQNSRLPHKEPLIFIKNLIEQNETEVTFESAFPFEPTLAMFCEASAQGSSFFPLSPHCTMGVVSSFRNVTLENQPDILNPLITITLLHSFNDSYLFKFHAHTPSKSFATGELAVFYMAG